MGIIRDSIGMRFIKLLLALKTNGVGLRLVGEILSPS